MPFDSKAYGSRVAQILALEQDGNRFIPLVSGGCSPREAHSILAKQKASELFPQAFAPQAALAGLWVYFSCFDEGHEIAQNVASAEGSFWHAILHRQEPDAGNAAYWFRQLGSHPVFPKLANASARLAGKYPAAGFSAGDSWDPFSFIDFCERARKTPGSEAEQAAVDFQRTEWQVLFDYCARPQP